jgi:hypothetical protein
MKEVNIMCIIINTVLAIDILCVTLNKSIETKSDGEDSVSSVG